jgi:hypothetical protein
LTFKPKREYKSEKSVRKLRTLLLKYTYTQNVKKNDCYLQKKKEEEKKKLALYSLVLRERVYE